MKNKQPKEVQDILDTFNFDNDAYKECSRIVKELNAIGYDAEYYLDGEIDLKSIKKISINTHELRVVEISTTSFQEEDFRILTNLTDHEIMIVIEPIVMSEREDQEQYEYDNEALINALIMCYPDNLTRSIDPINKIII
jgi:hypothetical protein